MLDAGGGLEDGEGNNKVRRQANLLLIVDGQTMRAELLLEDIECALNILWPLMDDVKILIRFDEAAGRST